MDVFVAPRTDTEKQLAAVWVEILGAENVSANDTFLSAGGESILALQCLNRVRTLCGVELSPVVLFADDATISELAKSIDEQKALK